MHKLNNSIRGPCRQAKDNTYNRKEVKRNVRHSSMACSAYIRLATVEDKLFRFFRGRSLRADLRLRPVIALYRGAMVEDLIEDLKDLEDKVTVSDRHGHVQTSKQNYLLFTAKGHRLPSDFWSLEIMRKK